jgi:preflagellin peptidase FlaK
VPSVVDTLLSSPLTDLLRLFAVPVFAWAAYRDVTTRRVPNVTWLPLVALGAVLLVADAAQVWPDPYRRQLFLLHAAISLGIVAPLGYVFWRLGGFGGADAKAVMTLALLFPEFPTYFLPSGVLPPTAFQPPLGVASMTILTNTVVVAVVAPLALAARNLAAGRLAPAMFLGRPLRVEALTTAYGRLLETRDGFTRQGLDLDALRMYLRWRRLPLSALRGAPDHYREPGSLPPEAGRGDPGDGALDSGTPVPEAVGVSDEVANPDEAAVPDDGTAGTGTADDEAPAAEPDGAGERVAPEDGVPERPVPDDVDPDDEWGAAAFLASLEGSAYGTTPEALRDGLAVVADREAVWVTPGLPFVVPMFLGLVVTLLVGDLLYVLLSALGLAP